MKTEIIKLSVLTFLAGMFCKIYDDMNDNDTIDKIEQLRLNIPYKELDWKPWPDTDVAIGSVSILPLFILSKIISQL